MKSLEEFTEEHEPQPLNELKDHDLVVELERRGWIAHHDDPKAERHVNIDAPKKGKVRFSIVGDTHLGSKYQQLTYWRAFYDAAREFKVEFQCQ